jgi:hypothetical protein
MLYPAELRARETVIVLPVDGTYRVRTVPTWAREGSHDVRVTVALETPSLHRRLMRQSFVITPENQLRDS